jgi:hypothetical protein
MAKKRKIQRPEIVDTSGLSDSHWTEINKLLRAFDEGGDEAFWSAVDDLGKRDPIDQCLILSSFFPEMMRELLKDAAAASGMSEEDIRDLQRKLQRTLSDDPGTRH